MKNLKGLFVYSVINMLERFSFYTMMAVLVFSLVEIKGYNSKDAGLYYAIFYGLTYISILIMGLIGDFANRRKLILVGLILISAGYILYPLYSNPHETLLIISALFVIIGIGAFKPNLYVQVGDLYRNNLKGGILAYIIFYASINAGAIFAPITAIYFKHTYGIDYVFYACGGASIIALVLYYFLSTSNKEQEDTLAADLNNTAKPTHNKEFLNNKYGMTKTISLISLLILVPIFWFAYYQTGLVFTLYVRDHVILKSGDVEFYQAIQPNASIIFSIIVAVIIFLFVKIKKSREIFLIIITGMILVAISNAIPAIGLANNPGKISFIYVTIPILIHAFGEILITPLIMFGVYHFSPFKIRGFFIGLVLFLTAVGNQFLFVYAIIYEKHGVTNTFISLVLHILICAVLMFGIWTLLKKQNPHDNRIES